MEELEVQQVEQQEATQSATAPGSEEQQAETRASDAAGEGEGSTAEAKTFTQEELNEIVKKEKAKAEAKAERRVIRQLRDVFPQQQQQQHQPVQDVDDRPRRDAYASDEAFIDALTDWKLEQREVSARRSQIEQSNQTLAVKTENLYKEAEKLPGFDRDEFEQLPLTPAIAQALIDSDQAPKLMAYMASNPQEVERISALSPARQAAELGKLELKVAGTPVKTTKAPPPINPVNAGKGKASVDLSTASVDDYIATRLTQKPIWAR